MRRDLVKNSNWPGTIDMGFWRDIMVRLWVDHNVRAQTLVTTRTKYYRYGLYAAGAFGVFFALLDILLRFEHGLTLDVWITVVVILLSMCAAITFFLMDAILTRNIGRIILFGVLCAGIVLSLVYAYIASKYTPTP